jgi:hypothetical protein
MRSLLAGVSLLGLALASPAHSQPTPVAGLAFGASERATAATLDEACDSVVRIEVEDTRMPAASESEVHLRCSGLALADGARVDAALFTLADNALILVEGRGNVSALIPATDPMVVVDGWAVYDQGSTVLREDTDQAWHLAPAALQAFMMFWDNPAWTNDNPASPTDAFFIPPEIRFGASFDDIHASLDGACDLRMVQEIEEIWLETEPRVQRQIDCMGYEIGGYPRRLEFVFGDGQLEQMWILFGAGDNARIRDFLTAEHGAPDQVGEVYEAFDGWRVALRKDKFEILMGSEALAEIWRETR